MIESETLCRTSRVFLNVCVGENAEIQAFATFRLPTEKGKTMDARKITDSRTRFLFDRLENEHKFMKFIKRENLNFIFVSYSRTWSFTNAIHFVCMLKP